MRSDQTISRKPQYIRWWLLASALIAVGLILIYYISPSIRNERKAAQKRFNEIQRELASVTGDQLVFESNPAGNVIDGDGEKIHKDCFTGEAALILGTSRPFGEVIAEYQTDLQILNYEPFEKNPVVQFQDTPDTRGLYWFYSKEISIDIHKLLESKGELTSYALDQTEYETYYLVSLEIMYPSYAACQLVGY